MSAGRRGWLPVLALAAASGALRLAGMAGAPIWYDEPFTLRVIAPGGPGDLWTRVGDTESTPPLSYLLDAGVQGLGLDGLVAIRLVSVLAAIGIVVVAFWATRRWVGPRAGLVAAAIVALHPLVTTEAINGRSYALLLLLAFALTGVLARALERADARTLAAWAVLAVLACWTHYFAIFLLIAGTAGLLVLRPEARRRIALATIAWMIPCLPLLALVARQGADERAGQIGARPLGERVTTAGRELLGGETSLSNLTEGLVLALAAGGIVAGVVCAVVGRRRARGSAAGPAPEVVLAVLAAATVAMPLLIGLLSEHYDRFLGRNVIVALPGLVVLLAAGLSPRRPVAHGALTGLLVLLGLGTYLTLFDWRYALPDDQANVRLAGPQVRRYPVLFDHPGTVVVPFLLQRTPAPAEAPLTTARLDVLLSPQRAGTRTFTPLPVPATIERLTALGFTVAGDRLHHAARHLVLRAPRPIAVPPGTTAPLGLLLPGPVTAPRVQRSLLGDGWG